MDEQTYWRDSIGTVLAETDCTIYVDVTPLFDENWTGIPVVTANLCERLLSFESGRVRFFFEYQIVAESAVRDALARASGLYLVRDFFRGDANLGYLMPLPDNGISVGLHSSVKRVRRMFDIECSILHDLSTMITPQFHTADNISYHMQSVIDDIESNDVTFCVSDATLSDVSAYLGYQPPHLVRAHNGVSWPSWYEAKASNEFDIENIEPYFLILGTREPRKNLGKVLDLLTLFPKLGDTHKFVFVGGKGWLMEEDLAARPGVDATAFVFMGFVSDYQKYRLLRGAEATIYPSYFEGFGLPVIESLSVGTPCIASFSSAISEIGGEHCFYFDPLSVSDLYRAVREVQLKRPKFQENRRAAYKTFAATYSWEGTITCIMRSLIDLIVQRRCGH